jgi:isochorismate pyruvate lyase
MFENRSTIKTPEACETIDDVRHAIDVIDQNIVAALGHRFEYVKAIMRFKSTEDDVRAPERYQAVMQQRRIWAEEAGLDPAVIEQIYTDLIAYFIRHEMDVLNRDEAKST